MNLNVLIDYIEERGEGAPDQGEPHAALGRKTCSYLIRMRF